MVMRDNAISKALSTLVDGGLYAMGITGISVIQHAQPIATSDHACVLISKISVHRYGWQGVNYDRDTGSPKTLKEGWDYFDECDYQISSFIPRNESDGIDKLTSYDLISALVTYFSSYRGIMAMKKVGFQPLRVTEIQVPVQQDDSSSPQFNPNFELRFLIHQTPSVEVPAIEVITIPSTSDENDGETSPKKPLGIHHIPDESPALDEIAAKLEKELEARKKSAKEIIVDFHHEGIREPLLPNRK